MEEEQREEPGPSAKRRQSTESNDSATKQEKKKHAGDREGDRRGGDRGDRGGRGERGARKPLRRDESVVITRPHEKERNNPNKEDIVRLNANYFRLKTRPNWAITKYHVDFEPEVMMRRLRSYLVGQHKERLGGYMFDGTQLFLTKPLSDNSINETILESETKSGEKFKLTLKLTKVVQPHEDEYVQMLNLIARLAIQTLHLQLVNRNFFDPVAKIDLNAFHIQLWPGYQTSIRKYEKDILLGCDVIHKVMRTDTVYDLLKETLNLDRANFQKNFKEKVLGLTVLTEYNNKTYRIDDVDFEKSPKSTFNRRQGEISFAAYYKERYNLEIKDFNQPLLVTKSKEKNMRGGQQSIALLVPELCRMTGLSERQRTDISLKNAMKPFSQMPPRTRIERLLKFNERIKNPESRKILDEWNLRLEDQLVEINGHQLKPEQLSFGGGRTHNVVNAGWDRECGRGLKLFQSMPLKRWYCVFGKPMERDVNKFVNRLIELCQQMGFEMSKPRNVIVENDRRMPLEIERLVNTGNPQMLFFAVSSNNSDTYGSIKKVCYETNPIGSQVVTKRILTREKGFDSVVTKVGIQMCTKLGGAPWMPSRIPLKSTMTIGFDVGKDSVDKRRAYGCLVATMDLKEGANFYSTVTESRDADKLSTDFAMNVVKALHAFRERHGTLPLRIIIYRGGVGDGDIKHVQDVEIKALEDNVKPLYEKQNIPLQMAFMIVSKRVNTRIFGQNGINPKPGIVVDETITLNERYEFFLVSQFANQGTLSPTNYNVIFDTVDLTPDKLQIWTYKQTHIYFNWCGTTRVPSVLQYATKLAFLVSNYMHSLPNASLSDKLFFL